MKTKGEGQKVKIKDNPPMLQPSLKLRLSKKATVDKESKKIKVKQWQRML
jgi:hypothetical protein